MFKFVTLLLKLAHLIALREEKAQAEKQKSFKKHSAKKAIKLRTQQRQAEAKARSLAARAATANAQADLGCNQINEAERLAATLRNKLDYAAK